VLTAAALYRYWDDDFLAECSHNSHFVRRVDTARSTSSDQLDKARTYLQLDAGSESLRLASMAARL
jgi:hypothetical protein